MDNGGAGGGLLSQPVSAFLYCHLVPWDNFIPSPRSSQRSAPGMHRVWLHFFLILFMLLYQPFRLCLVIAAHLRWSAQGTGFYLTPLGAGKWHRGARYLVAPDQSKGITRADLLLLIIILYYYYIYIIFLIIMTSDWPQTYYVSPALSWAPDTPASVFPMLGRQTWTADHS